jgi:hypothetical protein
MLFLKKKIFDDGYNPKTRFFEMHHTPLPKPFRIDL